MDLVVTVFLIISVFFASYYVTKFIAANGIGVRKSRCMEILDKIVLTRNLCVYLIKIGGCAIAISVGDKGTNVLAKYDNYELATIENMENITNNKEIQEKLQRYENSLDENELSNEEQSINMVNIKSLIDREFNLNKGSLYTEASRKKFEKFDFNINSLFHKVSDFLFCPDDSFMMDKKMIEKSLEHEEKIDAIIEKIKNRGRHEEENIRRVV